MPLDCHLMIVEPERYVEAFKEAGRRRASRSTSRPAPHLHRALQHIQSLGMRAGRRAEPVARTRTRIAYVIDVADLVLVMSVNPGFGGQSFIPEVLPKVRAIRQMIDATGARLDARDRRRASPRRRRARRRRRAPGCSSPGTPCSRTRDYARRSTAIRREGEAGVQGVRGARRVGARAGGVRRCACAACPGPRPRYQGGGGRVCGCVRVAPASASASCVCSASAPAPASCDRVAREDARASRA